MAADINDKLRKYKSLYSSTLSTGIGTGTGDTITPASVVGLATDTAITLTFDRVDSSGTATPAKLERIKGIISGGNFTAYVREIDGTTEQAHTAGAVIEMVWNAADWNDMVDWGLVAHNQDGTHKSGSVFTLPQINDTSSNHQYIFGVSELTADRTVTLPLLTGNDEFVFKDHTQTLTNKRVTKRVTAIVSNANPTINTDNCDVVDITAQAADIASMTTNLSGTPTNFQTLIIRFKDDGTARGITWGASFEARGVALPTTTVISKVLTVGFIYDTTSSKWGCVASAQEA